MTNVEKMNKHFSSLDGTSVLTEFYGEQTAIDAANKALASEKWADPDFLAGLKNAEVKFERRYVPVYKCVGEVIFKLPSQTEDGLTERRGVEKLLHSSPYAKLQVEGISENGTALDGDGLAAICPQIVENATIPKSNLEREALLAAQKSAPQKSVVSQSSVQVFAIFVPVAVLSYTFRGETFECFVNLHSGKTELSYPVSPKLEKDVEKTVQKVKGARRSSFFAMLFLLTFAALSWFKYTQAKELVDFANLLSVTIFAIVPVISWCVTYSYKRKKLAKDARELGKIKSPVVAIIFAALSWVFVAVGVGLFATGIL